MSVLDDIWSAGKDETPPTLSGVLERFYRGRTSRKRNRPDVGDWSGVLQNILYFRSADGSFRNEELDSGNLRFVRLAIKKIQIERNEHRDRLVGVRSSSQNAVDCRRRLTALAVHALSSTRFQSYSDPGLLKSSLAWLHAQQNEDGSFGSENATLDERPVVTSFVLSALADVQHDDIV